MPKTVDLGRVTANVRAKGFECVEPLTRVMSKQKFRCFCGTEFETTAYKITTGHTKSCGCIKGRKKRKGTEHVPGEYYGVLKKNAEARGLEFAVTIEYLTTLLISQGFRCALSGLPIELKYGGIKYGANTASLDRRDNSRGYTPDNVQWVHKDINWMKQDFPQDHFLSLCESVTRTQVGHQPHGACQ